ncbi:MAG: hypothetical protein EBZ87_02525 [Microbacteriaceae bacterium]|nr:hypothetical protein [Microbacteriaceae bacterium]
MAYSIQPVTIWVNGQAQEGNQIVASIVLDNLSDYAQFYWLINKVSGEGDVKQSVNLANGNTTISGADYEAWSDATDVNLFAYQYICEQLNLTLIH